MKEATASEYYTAINRVGVNIRYMFGKRYTTTYVSVLGRHIAEKTDILERGMVVSTIYSVSVEEG